jgi:5'-methylthioadenosine phosphorylase
MNTKERADIGVFGGSGFYSLLENAREITVETPYGAPSDKLALGEVAGKRVAFLPRHGKNHQYPPHVINFRATEVKPGDMVVADQVVDRTTGRKDTFYEGPITTHVSFSDPYCPQLRPLAISALRAGGITTHETGTIVVIQGPRFSTRAESKWFQGAGWEVINMTQYPECYLARELEICYVNISLITDYDVGLPGTEPVSHEHVMKIFASNNERVKQAIFRIIESIPAERTCNCGSALTGAR